jgi:hypothetical protein
MPDFICDSSCAGNELGDCSHTKSEKLYPDPKVLTLVELDPGLEGTRYRLAWEQPDGRLKIFWAGETQHLWRKISNVVTQETDFVFAKRFYSAVSSMLC